MYFKLCNVNNFNYDIVRSKSNIKYIVVHYTAGNGDTARNNAEYFHRKKVCASAHYFVDECEVACSVPWYNVAWHCGGKVIPGQGGSVHGSCTNYNSIGVEMCSRRDDGGAYYFTDKTVLMAAQFVAELMRDYSVPIERVVRHYDVTGKVCPAPFVNDRVWASFKALVQKRYERVTDLYYEKLEEIPEGELRNTVAQLVKTGVIKGDGSGLHLTMDMIRSLVFCRRMIESVK